MVLWLVVGVGEVSLPVDRVGPHLLGVTVGGCCWSLVVECRSSGVGFQMLNVECWVSLSVDVAGPRLSGVDSRVLVVKCCV